MGHVYEGFWRNGLRHGSGTYTCSNGVVHCGEWRSGRRHGPGEERRPDGTLLVGTWVKDDLSLGGVPA
jgi:hypothetical protein